MIQNQTIFNKNTSNLFASRTYNQYINFYDLFLLCFEKLPNSIILNNIDCEKASNYFEEKYNINITQKFYRKEISESEKNIRTKEFYFVLDSLILVFFVELHSVYFLFIESKSEETNEIVDEIIKFKKRTKRKLQEIDLLTQSSHGINTSSLEITKPKLRIEDNYNDDFIDIHKIIHKRLSKINDKGLVLLHGKPGTGKTSYIRFLITSLKKKIIFLPPNMASAITNPDLITILIENPNSIFVIEDAETIITKREHQNSSAVSALLNISDGLLSDCLNIQIICSFNTDLSTVDKALLRKGRLIAKYEFKELETHKAQQLSNKLGFKTKFFNPTLLTDIYNQKESCFKEKEKRIGF